MARGGGFCRKYFFIPLQFFSYQDDSIAVTIDTFERIGIFRKKIYNRD